ncbi:MAG TPA: phage tail tape measure protein, partial [Oscillospiraceae bacterium]|nr:phage tail tape measure protein [Oscillospiraceae bacterium]
MSFNAIISADVKNFEAGIDKAIGDIDKLAKTASEKLERIGKSFENAGKKASIMSAAIVAAGGVMVSSFITQEKAERKLSAAINATGGDVEVLSARFKKFASDLQAVTLTGDETTLGMLQMAQTMGLTAVQSERAVKNAIAMESAFGVSAASAMRYTAALEDGDATMLKRYIPALKSIEDESLLAAKAQEILGNAFEVAKEDAQTFGGSFTQLKNSAGDLMEEFGAIISKALMPLVEWAKNAVEHFSNLDEGTKELIVTVGGIVAAIGPLLLILGTIVGKVVPAMLVGFKALRTVVMATSGAFAKLGVIIAANPIGAIAVGITAVIAALVIFNRRLSDTSTLSDKIMTDALKNTAGERVEVERLLRVLNSEKATREQKEKVLRKLNEISPEY